MKNILIILSAYLYISTSHAMENQYQTLLEDDQYLAIDEQACSGQNNASPGLDYDTPVMQKYVVTKFRLGCMAALAVSGAGSGLSVFSSKKIIHLMRKHEIYLLLYAARNYSPEFRGTKKEISQQIRMKKRLDSVYLKHIIASHPTVKFDQYVDKLKVFANMFIINMTEWKQNSYPKSTTDLIAYLFDNRGKQFSEDIQAQIEYAQHAIQGAGQVVVDEARSAHTSEE